MESQNYASAPGVAASGVALRQARESRGLGLAEVAATLKLSTRQIEAIEDETFDQLPGIAFARGFVRNYARFLGLDPAPLLERMEQPVRNEELRLSPESNAEGSVPRSPSGYRSASAMPAIALVGVIFAVGVLGFIFNWYGNDASPALEPGASQSIPAVGTGEPVFPPKSDETAVVTAQVEPVPESSPPVVEQSNPAAAQSAPQVSAAIAVPVTQSAPAVLGQGAGLVFSFAQDAWVEVRDGSGAVVFSQLNKAGSTQAVQGKPPFALVIGNATNVKLSYNGNAVDLAPVTKVSVARLTLK